MVNRSVLKEGKTRLQEEDAEATSKNNSQ